MAFVKLVVFTLLASAVAESSLKQQHVEELHKLLEARLNKTSNKQDSNASVSRQVMSPRLLRSLDCFTKSKLHIVSGGAALLQQHNVPGAGIDPFQPFEVVLKDGFMATTCVKDYMYSRGDKYGDRWASYKLGPVSNVSIVHYDEFVAKEDRQDMTQKVCFEFCRTVPNMGVFGIVNGRNCYCTPYFQAMESGSEQCDEVCEGDTTTMCGGKFKSSIFTMHMCQSTAKDLGARQAAALGMKANMEAQLAYAQSVSKILQESGEFIQKQFGPVGDSQATNLGQAEKVFAGILEHKTKVAADIAGELGSLSFTPVLKDFNNPATVTLSERVMEAIDDMLEQGDDFIAELHKLTSLAEHKSALDAEKQYYPAMYFVDKKFADVPSTCTGNLVGKPMVASKDSCAAACDAHIHSCVGYQFFGWDNTEVGTCHLFSNFKTAFYYTGCEKKKPSFLQTSKACARFKAGCFAKLSKFEGTNLKMAVTEADRCYDAGYLCSPSVPVNIHVVTLPPLPTTMAPTTAATTTPAPTPAPTTAPPTPAPTTAPPTPAPTTTLQGTDQTEPPTLAPTEPPTTGRPTRAPTTPASSTAKPTEDPRTGWCPRKCGNVDCKYRITNALAPYPTTCIHCTESVCKAYPKWSMTIAYDEEACTKCKYCLYQPGNSNRNWQTKMNRCAQYWK